MVICSKCGTQLPAGTAFCASCGTPIAQQAPPPPPSQPFAQPQGAATFFEKSKFGFNAAVYPLFVLFCILFSQIWVALLILGFVLIVEQNPKISKTTMSAALWAFVWPAYTLITGQLWKFYNYVLGKITYEWMDLPSESFVTFTKNMTGFFNILGSLLFVAFIVCVLLLGIVPLLSGKESKLPGGKIVDKLFN